MATMTRRLQAAVLGGLAGGAVFGILLAVRGMLPGIAKIVGTEHVVIGFTLHMLVSAVLGVLFGVTLGRFASSMLNGMMVGTFFGVVWWAVVVFVMVPMVLGAAAPFSVSGMRASLPLLAGHALYGVVLGVIYAGMVIGGPQQQMDSPKDSPQGADSDE